MASTPPGPFERCSPGSADHRCARRARNVVDGSSTGFGVIDLCRWCLSSDALRASLVLNGSQ